VVAVAADRVDRLEGALADAGIPGRQIGHVGGPSLRIAVAGGEMSLPLERLEATWRSPF